MARATQDRIVEGVEAWFEYSVSTKDTLENGNRVINDPEDERWEGELGKPPFKGGAHGYLNVADVTRVDGDIVKKKLIKGAFVHQNKAREFMREFARLKKAGAPKPWDQEHYFRHQKEMAEKAERDGRAHDLNVITEGLKAALGPLAAQRAPQTKGGDA